MEMDPQEKGQKTRAAILDAARELFSMRGYSAVGTEEVVKYAGVTRGALYHHFRDKRDLFRAVFRQMEVEVVDEILANVAESGVDDPIEAFWVGIQSFLDVCEDAARVQVGLIDAPSVLGWAEWREIGSEHGMSMVLMALQSAQDAGRLKDVKLQPLAHVLFAALGEAAMYIANARSRAAARREMEAALSTMLEGLRD